jgi:hypothetical protein
VDFQFVNKTAPCKEISFLFLAITLEIFKDMIDLYIIYTFSDFMCTKQNFVKNKAFCLSKCKALERLSDTKLLVGANVRLEI